MLDELKERTLEANLRIVREGLLVGTFGNVSAIDRATRLVIIKASGVPYVEMKVEHMVVVSLETGEALDSPWRPSSDTPTHLELYRTFPGVGGIVHTHSPHATAWAQARRPIPVLGTTHADYFNGPVPCTRSMRPDEIETDYEANTGKVIAERFADLSPAEFPGVLVASHGPVTWGQSVEHAVDHAVVIEYIARMASDTLRLDPDAPPVTDALLRKHFQRKHGTSAYYGQRRG